jgi:hypothetical protein
VHPRVRLGSEPQILSFKTKTRFRKLKPSPVNSNRGSKMNFKVQLMDEDTIDKSIESGLFFKIYEDWDYDDGTGWEDRQDEVIERFQNALSMYPKTAVVVYDESFPVVVRRGVFS